MNTLPERWLNIGGGYRATTVQSHRIGQLIIAKGTGNQLSDHAVDRRITASARSRSHMTARNGTGIDFRLDVELPPSRD